MGSLTISLESPFSVVQPLANENFLSVNIDIPDIAPVFTLSTLFLQVLIEGLLVL